MKKTLPLLALILTTTACSFLGPSAKKTEEYVGGMPDFHVFNDFSKVKGRTIASVKNQDAVKVESTINAFSNRKIYFLTLLSQYNEMKHITRIDSPEIKVCPSFHTEVLENKKLVKSGGKEFVDLSNMNYNIPELLKKDSQYLSLYPELSLPLTTESLHPSLIDSLNAKNSSMVGELLVKAYKTHLGKIYQELNEMCDKGQTDNFYVFENLVTYTKSHPDFKNSESALKSVMKSSLFANMYIIKSFKIKSTLERTVASGSEINSFEEEVVNRTDTFWVKNYFDEVKKRRAH